MSKVEGGGVRLSPLKASCNYFFKKASRVKSEQVLLLDRTVYELAFAVFKNNKSTSYV